VRKILLALLTAAAILVPVSQADAHTERRIPRGFVAVEDAPIKAKGKAFLKASVDPNTGETVDSLAGCDTNKLLSAASGDVYDQACVTHVVGSDGRNHYGEYNDLWCTHHASSAFETCNWVIKWTGLRNTFQGSDLNQLFSDFEDHAVGVSEFISRNNGTCVPWSFPQNAATWVTSTRKDNQGFNSGNAIGVRFENGKFADGMIGTSLAVIIGTSDRCTI
jgi:hypothetical protein